VYFYFFFLLKAFANENSILWVRQLRIICINIHKRLKYNRELRKYAYCCGYPPYFLLEKIRNMIRYLFLSLCVSIIRANHFGGGSISWMPTNPNDSSSTVTISIIQSYSWAYPTVTCALNVPVSTVGGNFSASNLTCIEKCSSDGGYSMNSISTLTDCNLASSTLGIMESNRLTNIDLLANASFYLAYRDTGWMSLTNYTQSNMNWSVVTFIDLGQRSNAVMNTPPIVNMIFTQYVLVNETISIPINTWDINENDDVRCRWSTNSGMPTINECGDICHPLALPQNIVLSNCILNFIGSIPNATYAVAIQVRNS